MARVESIGAVLTVLRLPQAGIGPDANPVHFKTMHLFARLETGLLIFGSRVKPDTVAFQREQLGDLDALILSTVRTANRRASRWQTVLEQLATLKVNTDAETLMRLPFELLSDAEVRAMLGDS